MVSLLRAIELVEKLSRTRNYPKDDEGVSNLAKGLQYAESKTNIGPGRIIERCSASSEFCPTDYDLLTVAQELAREDGVAAGTFDSMAGAGNAAKPDQRKQWEKEYGKPQAFPVGVIDQERLKKFKAREKALYSAIRKAHPEELDWHGMAAAAEEAGFHDYAKAWRRSIVGSA